MCLGLLSASPRSDTLIFHLPEVIWPHLTTWVGGWGGGAGKYNLLYERKNMTVSGECCSCLTSSGENKDYISEVISSYESYASHMNQTIIIGEY